MKVVIEEYLETHPNGDRSTNLVNSSRFEIVLDNYINKFYLKTFDCFDSYNCHVMKREKVLPKANHYATKLADFLNCGMGHKTYKKEKIIKEDWIEQE